jgi:hypothetical protein
MFLKQCLETTIFFIMELYPSSCCWLSLRCKSSPQNFVLKHSLTIFLAKPKRPRRQTCINMDEFNWQFCIFGSETEPYKTFMLVTEWWFLSSEYEAVYTNRNLADLVLWGYINSSTLNEEDCILKLRRHFHVLLVFQYREISWTSKCEGKTCSYTKWHRSTRSTLTCILNWETQYIDGEARTTFF